MERNTNMEKNTHYLVKSAREEKLKHVCYEYIKFLESTDYNEVRVTIFEARIFEAGLEYICGENIFEHVRELEMKAE